MSLSSKTKRYIDKNFNISLKNRTVLITGSTSGIGLKTAEEALYMGANVIIACRNISKGEICRNTLIREYPDRKVEIMKLDLADLSSVDEFADRLIREKTDIDCFINNAGVYHIDGYTADGFPVVPGTNYIGTFYLSERILEYLSKLNHEVVYINTISLSYRFADTDFSSLFSNGNESYFGIYAKSKLALAGYTCLIADRYKDSNIRILMNHPGIVITPVAVGGYGKIIKRLANAFSFLFNSTEKSALSFGYIMKNMPVAGSLIGPDIMLGGWGYPKQNRICRKSTESLNELYELTINEIKKVREKK